MVRELVVCINRRLSRRSPSCGARGGEAVALALEAAVRRRGLEVEVVRIHCFGRCERGPNVRAAPGGRFWHETSASDAEAILAAIQAPD